MPQIPCTVEEVRAIVGRPEYWMDGKEKGLSSYSRWYINEEWNRPIVEAFERALAPALHDAGLSGRRLLDLGCGFGAIVLCALRRGADAWGIDLSDFAVSKACSEPLLAGRILRGSMDDLPWRDEFFDVFYSGQVFEHIPAEVCPEMARELYRVARPGAVLWASLVLDETGKHQPSGYDPGGVDATHINLRPRGFWDDLFMDAGWDLEPEVDRRFRSVEFWGDARDYFEEYGWHSLSYRKP